MPRGHAPAMRLYPRRYPPLAKLKHCSESLQASHLRASCKTLALHEMFCRRSCYCERHYAPLSLKYTRTGGKPFSTSPCATFGNLYLIVRACLRCAFGKNSQLTKLEYFQRFWPPTTMFSPEGQAFGQCSCASRFTQKALACPRHAWLFQLFRSSQSAKLKCLSGSGTSSSCL